MILHGNLQDVFMNQVCLFVCVRGSVHPILPKKLYLHCFRVLRADICPLQDDYGIYPYPLTLQRQLAVQGRDFCAECKLVFFLFFSFSLFVSPCFLFPYLRHLAKIGFLAPVKEPVFFSPSL